MLCYGVMPGLIVFDSKFFLNLPRCSKQQRACKISERGGIWS